MRCQCYIALRSVTVLIQNKAPPQTTLLTMAYFETGNALDVSYRHQGGKVFVACYNSGISNNDLLVHSPFFPPGRLVCPWSTSLGYLLLSCFMFSRVFDPPTGVALFLLDAEKLLPSLFSLIFIHFLWAMWASAHIVQLPSSVHHTSLLHHIWINDMAVQPSLAFLLLNMHTLDSRYYTAFRF